MTSHAAVRARPPRLRGFTLIELLVTIALVAILLTLAAPSFVSFRKNSQLTVAANSLLAAAAAARAEAMKYQLDAFVRPASGNSWTNGWYSYVDGDWDTLMSSSVDIQIGSQAALPAGITTVDGTPSHYLMFTAAGYFGSPGTVAPVIGTKAAIQFTNGTDTRIFIVEGSGRMRVCNPATDTTCTATNVF